MFGTSLPSTFRPDNVYVDTIGNLFVNEHVPNDPRLPFLVKNNTPCEKAFHLHPLVNSSEHHDKETAMVEFLYSFGWFVWILLEGSGQVVNDDDNGGRQRHSIDRSIEQLQQTGRHRNYPDYLNQVMRICWDLRPNIVPHVRWNLVCQLIDENENCETESKLLHELILQSAVSIISGFDVTNATNITILSSSSKVTELQNLFNCDVVTYNKSAHSHKGLKFISQNIVGEHTFTVYSMEQDDNHRKTVLSSSGERINQHQGGVNYVLELFQYFSFYHWNSIDSLLWVLNSNEFNTANQDELDEFVESMLCIPILFCEFGLQIKEIIIVIPQDFQIADSIYHKQRDILAKLVKRKRSVNKIKVPFQLLYNGSIYDEQITTTGCNDEEILFALNKGCLLDMDKLSRVYPLGISALEIVTKLKTVDTIIVYKDDSLVWDQSQELLCLLALIQQTRNKKRFLLIKPPATKYPISDGKPHQSFLDIFNSYKQSTTEQIRSVIKQSVQESNLENIPQQQEEIMDIEEEDAEQNDDEERDITILCGDEPRDRGRADYLKQALIEQGFRVYLPALGNDDDVEIPRQTFNSVQRSKLVIALFSENFLRSPTCYDQLILALWHHSLRNPTLKLLCLVINLSIMARQDTFGPACKKERVFCCIDVVRRSIDDLSNDAINFIAQRVLRRNGVEILIDNRFQFLADNTIGIEITDQHREAIQQWINHYEPALPNGFPFDLPVNFIHHDDNNQIKINYVILN